MSMIVPLALVSTQTNENRTKPFGKQSHNASTHHANYSVAMPGKLSRYGCQIRALSYFRSSTPSAQGRTFSTKLFRNGLPIIEIY